ncbi:MAG: hypothetical protein RLZZ241_1823 [Bacteroidota bacterium]|jgi:hypothetical protein
MVKIVRALVIPALMLLLAMLLSNCGPVVITSRIGTPPPPWFYPHRVEMVRYIYFPELVLYFDLRTHTYLYREGIIWRRQPELPPQYRNYDLSRERYQRIQNYDRDDIKPYHEQYQNPRTRSSRSPNIRQG